MKIAIANNLYYPYNRGGAETVIKNMISDLKSQGHEIFLITTKPKHELDQIDLDLKVYYFPSDYSRLSEFTNIQKTFWHLGNIFSFQENTKIKKVLETEKPDLIMTHNLMGLGFRLPTAIRDLKIKHEHYLHDIQLLYPSGLMMLGEEKIVDSLSAKIYQFFNRIFFNSPDKIISPSNWLLDQHLKRGFFKNSKTEVKNLIKIENNQTTEQIDKKPNLKNNFLFVGQIEYHKGIIFLIKAFKEALLINSKLKLTIIGDGELIKSAKELSDREEQIEFKGRLDSEDVKTLMIANDCLIIPSLCYENAPMTIFEAHANSLSVLAANIGGIPEIISSNDRLFKAGDIEDLKNKILNLK